ncbi:unnamed protein product [Calypogeia fissa]
MNENNQAGSHINMTSSPTPMPMAGRLRTAALSCCSAGGDDESVTEFMDVLRAPFKVLDRGTEWQLDCECLLQEARSLLDPSATSGKELMDLVGVELPKVVVQYAGVSKECYESSSRLIQGLATAFDPAREMYTAFFEVINMYSKPETVHLCLPILRGLSLVFPRIKRRTTEFFKEAVPGLLELSKFPGQSEVDSCSPEDVRNDSLNPERHLFLRDHPVDDIQNSVMSEMIHLAKVMKGICDGLQEMDRLQDILDIFILQLLTTACRAMSDSTGVIPDRVLELMELLSFSDISLSKVDKKFEVDIDEDENNTQKNRLEAERGAALAVYWGIQTGEAHTISGELAGLKEMLQKPGRETVLDIFVLASPLLVPAFGAEAISFVHKGLSIMTYILEIYDPSSEVDDDKQRDEALDIQIMPALQRLQDVIVYLSSPMLRRQAYGVMIKVITEVLPTRARFDTLDSLIKLSGQPSLVSLLLTCVKDEVQKSWPTNDGNQKLEHNGAKDIASSLSPFTSRKVLDFIQCVVRTNDGEIVELPANLDAVIGGLNLYRFLLLRESSGNTNYTSVLSREELVKGRTYWLLPVRAEILRLQSLFKSEGTDTYQEIQMAMDSLQFVLYRCLEIVEELLAKTPN